MPSIPPWEAPPPKERFDALPAVAEGLSIPDWKIRRAALAALVTLARHGDPAAVAELAAASSSEDGQVASTASAALAALGVKSVPGLIRALGNAEPGVVEIASAALAALGPSAAEALPTLMERFGHEDWRVRSAVLGAIPAVDGAGDRTVDFLLAAGEDADILIRGRAREAWERIRAFSPAGLKRLLLIFGGIDEEKRGTALRAIQRSRCAAPEAVRALSAVLRAGPSEFRVLVAEVLVDVLPAPDAGALKAELASTSWERRVPAAAACAHAGPAGEAFALVALADPEAAVRLCALTALRRLRATGATAAFSRALRDVDAACRAAAAGGLAAIRAAEAVGPLRAALKDVDETVRDQAVYALGRIGAAAASAVPELAERLKEPGFDRVRTAIALGRIGPAGVRAREGLLAVALAEGRDPARRAAVDALGRIGGDSRPLEPLLRSEDPDLRLAAELAVARMSGALGPALRGLVDALRDPNIRVRGRAARAMGRLGAAAASAVPALIDRLAEPDEERLLDIAHALGGIGSAAAVPGLAALLARAANLELREELTKALEKIGTESPPAGPLPDLASPRATAATPVDASLARVRPRIARVEPGSPAAGWGLKVGDRLLDVEGAPMLTAVDWPRSLVKMLGRTSIRATFYREGERLVVQAPAGFCGFELEDTLDSLAEAHARTPEHQGRAFEYLRRLFLAGDYVRCAEIGRRLHAVRPGTPAEALAGASAVAYGVRAGNRAMAEQGLQWVESYRALSMADWSTDVAAIAEYAKALWAESKGDLAAAQAGYARAVEFDPGLSKAAEALARTTGRGTGAVAADPSTRWVGRMFPTSYTLPWLPALEPPDGKGEPRTLRGPLVVVLLGRRRSCGPADEQLGRLAVLARQTPLRVHLITAANEREHPAFHDGERALRDSLDVLHDAPDVLTTALGVSAVPAIFFVNAEGVVEEQGTSVTDAMARRVIARAEGRLAWRKASEALPSPTSAEEVWEGRVRAFIVAGNGFKPGAEDMKALDVEVKAAYPGLVFDERTLTARLGTAGWPGAPPEKELTAAVRSMDVRLAEAIGASSVVRWHGSAKAAVLLATSDLPRIVLRMPGPWADPGAMFRELIAKGGLQGAGERVRDPQSGRTFVVEIHPAPGGFVPQLVGPGGSKENATALARVATSFVRAGATEVGIWPAGPVHPAARWGELDLLSAFTAVVGKRSRGMQVFGLRDTEAPTVESVRLFNRWQLAERPALQDGQTLEPPGGKGRCLLLARGDVENPYGIWVLTPV